MVVHDVVKENWLMPVQKYTAHVVITRGSISLPGTDDTLKVKESRVFLRIRIKEWSENGKKISIWYIFLIFEMEESSGRGLLSVIKNNLTLCWTNIFNNLYEWLNGEISTKIGWGMLVKGLMDRECNCSPPSKVNRKCVCDGKFRSNCLIYEVKCLICDAIYIGNK